jgi:hypothetical protein
VAADVANPASRLGGSYSVIEDIGGNFMREMLATPPAAGEPQKDMPDGSQGSPRRWLSACPALMHSSSPASPKVSGQPVSHF